MYSKLQMQRWGSPIPDSEVIEELETLTDNLTEELEEMEERARNAECDSETNSQKAFDMENDFEDFLSRLARCIEDGRITYKKDDDGDPKDDKVEDVLYDMNRWNEYGIDY